MASAPRPNAKRGTARGCLRAPHPPEAFGRLLQSEIDRWGKVIRAAHVTVQ
ncbi:MAG TPA: hypothetical protein VLN42_06810 [Casimicrobiaceae bacterium]|nr:hypothetical protein [Casimicrobiaceae bacterium]